MNLEDVLLLGTRASQPAASSIAEGILYSVTDEDNLVEQSRGGVWVTYSGVGGGSSASGGQVANFPYFPELVEHDEPIVILPTQNQIRQILAGTNVTFDDTVAGFRTINASSGGGGAGWTLIETKASPAGPTVDFVTGIATYSELLVAAVLVETDSNTSIKVVISIDGGTNWQETSGNYKVLSFSDGTETNDTAMNISGGVTMAARTCFARIINSNGTTRPKLLSNEIITSPIAYRIPTTSAINGIRFRVTNTGASNFVVGGNFYVFGKV